MFKRSNVRCFEHSSPKKSSKATVIHILIIDELILQIYSARRQVESFCRSVSSFAGRIFETEARLGLVWTLLIRWWKWSWVPEFWNLRITSTTTPAVFFFDSDSSQMLFNPYTCWGINTRNTGTRLYHVRSRFRVIYRAVSIEMRSDHRRLVRHLWSVNRTLKYHNLIQINNDINRRHKFKLAVIGIIFGHTTEGK